MGLQCSTTCTITKVFRAAPKFTYMQKPFRVTLTVAMHPVTCMGTDDGISQGASGFGGKIVGMAMSCVLVDRGQQKLR